MSLPATHLYYIQRQLQDENLDPDFLLGNILPDARYVFGLSRKNTHFDITTESMLAEYIKKRIPAKIKLYQKKILAGMFCHSYHDFWWRDGVYIETDNPFIKPALFLAEEQICGKLLDKKNIIRMLSMVQRHSIFDFSEDMTASFVENIIDHLYSTTFDSSPLLQFWKTTKGWTTDDVKKIDKTVLSLSKNVKFIEQTNSLKSVFFKRGLVKLLRKYALQENNSGEIK